MFENKEMQLSLLIDKNKAYISGFDEALTRLEKKWPKHNYQTYQALLQALSKCNTNNGVDICPEAEIPLLIGKATEKELRKIIVFYTKRVLAEMISRPSQ